METHFYGLTELKEYYIKRIQDSVPSRSPYPRLMENLRFRGTHRVECILSSSRSCPLSIPREILNVLHTGELAEYYINFLKKIPVGVPITPYFQRKVSEIRNTKLLTTSERVIEEVQELVSFYQGINISDTLESHDMASEILTKLQTANNLSNKVGTVLLNKLTESPLLTLEEVTAVIESIKPRPVDPIEEGSFRRYPQFVNTNGLLFYKKANQTVRTAGVFPPFNHKSVYLGTDSVPLLVRPIRTPGGDITTYSLSSI